MEEMTATITRDVPPAPAKKVTWYSKRQFGIVDTSNALRRSVSRAINRSIDIQSHQSHGSKSPQPPTAASRAIDPAIDHTVEKLHTHSRGRHLRVIDHEPSQPTTTAANSSDRLQQQQTFKFPEMVENMKITILVREQPRISEQPSHVTLDEVCCLIEVIH